MTRLIIGLPYDYPHPWPSGPVVIPRYLQWLRRTRSHITDQCNTVSDSTVSDSTVSDLTVSDSILSDSTLSDWDMPVSDSTVSDSTVSDSDSPVIQL